MKKLSRFIPSLASIALPLMAAAQGGVTSLDYFLNTTLITNVINPITAFIFVLAAFVLILGIFKYITAGGDEEKVKSGRSFIIYGIIGLALMTMIYGLVNIITGTIGLTDADLSNTPSF